MVSVSEKVEVAAEILARLLSKDDLRLLAERLEQLAIAREAVPAPPVRRSIDEFFGRAPAPPEDPDAQTAIGSQRDEWGDAWSRAVKLADEDPKP